MKTAIAIRHVAFEDLGAFEPAIRAAGYRLHYVEAGEDMRSLVPPETDLLIVLGGPIGAYDDETYPFLLEETEIIAERLQAGKPTLGICLGAQLIARAAGARVYPGAEKEIGYAPIALTEAGAASCLAPFAEDGTTLHWHGDTFDLPEGAELLASTPLCANQAFALGRNIIAFQFHPEAGGDLEAWLIGHTCELSTAGIDIPALRDVSRRLGTVLAQKAHATIVHWLGQLDA